MAAGGGAGIYNLVYPIVQQNYHILLLMAEFKKGAECTLNFNDLKNLRAIRV